MANKELSKMHVVVTEVNCLIGGQLLSLARLAVKVKDEMAEEDDN